MSSTPGSALLACLRSVGGVCSGFRKEVSDPSCGIDPEVLQQQQQPQSATCSTLSPDAPFLFYLINTLSGGQSQGHMTLQARPSATHQQDFVMAPPTDYLSPLEPRHHALCYGRVPDSFIGWKANAIVHCSPERDAKLDVKKKKKKLERTASFSGNEALTVHPLRRHEAPRGSGRIFLKVRVRRRDESGDDEESSTLQVFLLNSHSP